MHQGEYLKKLIGSSKLTVGEVARALGISRANMYLLFKKKRLDDYYLDKIRQTGFDLEAPVVKKGVVKEGHSRNNLPVRRSGEREVQIPFYEANITGGIVNNFGDQVKNASYFLSIPHFRDCHIAVRVNGHSMYPKYCNGDIVVCKKINHHDHVSFGDPYVVALADYSVLKYIHPHPTDKNLYLLKSANEKFEPMPIRRKDVLGAYLVRGKIELT